MSASFIKRLSDNNPESPMDDGHWKTDTLDTLSHELSMLLTSRVRITTIEDVPLINASILNYGFNESRLPAGNVPARHQMIAQQLKNMLARFEPRLALHSITAKAVGDDLLKFSLHIYWQSCLHTMTITWNDNGGILYVDK